MLILKCKVGSSILSQEAQLSNLFIFRQKSIIKTSIFYHFILFINDTEKKNQLLSEVDCSIVYGFNYFCYI